MVGCDFGLQKLRGLAAATQDFCLMTAATLIKITLQRERERESPKSASGLASTRLGCKGVELEHPRVYATMYG